MIHRPLGRATPGVAESCRNTKCRSEYSDRPSIRVVSVPAQHEVSFVLNTQSEVGRHWSLPCTSIGKFGFGFLSAGLIQTARTIITGLKLLSAAILVVGVFAAAFVLGCLVVIRKWSETLWRYLCGFD